MRAPFSTSMLRIPSLVVTFFLLLSLFSSVSSQNATKKICQTKECLSAAQNLKESIDNKADPCEDFYQYACGNWPNVHKNTNGSDIPASTVQLRVDENIAELGDYLKQKNTDDEPEAVHKARKFFWLCLNEAAYSNKLERIQPTLKEIGIPLLAFITKENNDFDYATATVKAAKLAGVSLLFDLTTDLDPRNQTVNRIVLSNIKETSNLPYNVSLTSKEKISEAQFMADVMLRMCQSNPSASCTVWNSPKIKAKNDTINIILMQQDEIRQINAEPHSDPALLTLKELQNRTDSIAIELNTTIPKWNWTRYIEETFTDLDNVTLHLSDSTKIQITSLGSVEEIIRVIYENENIKLLEIELWWKVVSKLLPYIDLKICDTKNKLNSLEVSPTRERSCIENTKKSFNLAVSYAYTTKEKYVIAKTDIIRKMFEHIRDSLEQIIEEAPWMDKTTRQRALKKLLSMKSYLVYPSAIKETNILNDLYKDIKVSNDFYDTMSTIAKNRAKKTLNTQNQMNDLNKTEIRTDINPSDVNAVYDPRTNTMIIPAGILGLSLYNHSLRALDYGAIGSIIGHELTHAFDNNGRKYNETGGIEDWWQPETLKTYIEKGKCFVDAYGNYSTNFGGIEQKTDSGRSLGENIADNGGFRESLFAYRRRKSELGEEPLLPQFENVTHEQLLTLAFANVYCENPTEASSFIFSFATHSPGAVRVNGVLQNSKEFAEIWKCPKGSKMNPNKEKCSLF